MMIQIHQGMIYTTPKKIPNITMEKQAFESMYLLLKMVIFHCHVSFLEGINIYIYKYLYSLIQNLTF